MIGKILQLNTKSTHNLKSNVFQPDNEGENIYMGPERRNERRRERKNERFENMIKDFGLERRLRVERRDVSTSWLLTSKMVINS